MKKWIRLTIEILLGAGVIGSGTFIYLQMTEISELEAQIANLNKSSVKRPSSDSSLSPIRLEQLIAKEKELEAVKSALSNGLALSDVENAAKNAKNESPERYLAIGALRLLVKGKEDPARIFTIVMDEKATGKFLTSHKTFLNNYRKGNWGKAKANCEKLLITAPKELNKYYEVMLERINELERTTPENWTGVFVATSK